MISKLYVSYDVIAQEGSNPFVARNDGLAVRLFNQARNQMDKSLMDPRDFQLYCIGTYDSDKMIITGSSPMVVPTIEDDENVEGI